MKTWRKNRAEMRERERERARWLERGGLEDDELGNVFGKNSSIEVKRPKQREIRKKMSP